MLLKKITLNDFGVYGGRNEFDFTTTPEKKIILVGGTNGAGKTTLFESVMLCLYGYQSFEPRITQKQYQDRILRSIHRYLGTRKAADEASIVVEFQFAHEGKITEYQVRRMWQNNDGKLDEKLTILKRDQSDENYIPLDSIEESEWQVFIDQLLPRGITKLFFFDGEKIQSIADSGEEDRFIKSSFDVLLGLDLVKQLHDDISITLLRESNDDTQKILEELEILTKEKQEYEKRLQDHQEEQKRLKGIIKNTQLQIASYEEEFKRLGGKVADNREQLVSEKFKIESKLENTKKEIRDLCSTILPFSLIPKQLENLKNEIKLDQQTIQTLFEKEILETNFKELLKKIKSNTFLSDDTIRSQVVKQIEEFFEEKITSIKKLDKPLHNLSQQDMSQLIQFIDVVNETTEQKMESLTKSYGILMNSLERINVSLNNAPKDDVIGPIFSKLSKANIELGELQNELEHALVLEAQEKSLIVLVNTKIRTNLAKRSTDKKRLAGLDLGPKVQQVLEEYSKLLRNKKLELLENYILDALKMLLHKKDFIDKVSINRETFEVKLYKGNDDEITKDMLSKGELQMFATAIVWGLAKTSGRPLPFMIDTPLARLDEEHRIRCVGEFYPNASHQTIILSTDSEINFTHYQNLKPYLANSFVIQYDSSQGKTIKHVGYFYDEKGEKIIEV